MPRRFKTAKKPWWESPEAWEDAKIPEEITEQVKLTKSQKKKERRRRKHCNETRTNDTGEEEIEISESHAEIITFVSHSWHRVMAELEILRKKGPPIQYYKQDSPNIEQILEAANNEDDDQNDPNAATRTIKGIFEDLITTQMMEDLIHAASLLKETRELTEKAENLVNRN